MPTIVIDNFKGNSTVNILGDMNSGLTNNNIAAGYDPLSKPGLLTWSDAPVQIDVAGAVITDCILSGKTRVESGVTYVYAIGHTGRLYKIQVNDPNTFNADYDNPVLLATLSINSPTFTRGGFLDFCGTPQQIFIGHDMGITTIHFDGTAEAFLGVLGSYTQNVPRPLQQFIGKLYAGNGSNLAEIDISGTGSVNSYARLSPGFPTNTQIRDMDITPDGNYLQSTVTELALSDITSTAVDTTIIAPSNSYTFVWNGTDLGYTSTTFYPSTVLSSATMFGNKQYIFGYDFLGGAIYDPIDKIITSLPSALFSESPFPNAVVSSSNTLTWMGTFPFNGVLTLIYVVYGTISTYDIKPGYWTPMTVFATAPETDVLHIPFQINVSNFATGTSFSGYSGNVFGLPKVYYSTIEVSSAPTTKYRFYKWNSVITGFNPSLVGLDSIYQTQTQPFSKKVKVSEIRVYGWPWVANNSFQIDLIGTDGNIIPGTTKVFTAGTNLTIGDDFAWYSPDMSPRYALALRITNLGTANHTISKVEIDWDSAGK